jgi:2-dehydro-3-deoxyphosphogluconate aldolase / (4S)-4-hydroxy-2-oxoglutarate aldolase
MIPREVVGLMERRRLVAEVRTETAIQALGVVDSLTDAGITMIEISVAIPGAHEILAHLAPRQDVLVGAGSVVDTQQAREALSFGAKFIASPVLSYDLIKMCRESNITCIPGALTPTEILAAQRAGAEMVKIFPADVFDGPMYVRSLFRQMPGLSLQISGNIPAEQLVEYFETPIRAVALGDFLMPPQLVNQGNWSALTARAQAFVDFVESPNAFAAQFLNQMGVAPRPRPSEMVFPSGRPMQSGGLTPSQQSFSQQLRSQRPTGGQPTDGEGWLR